MLPMNNIRILLILTALLISPSGAAVDLLASAPTQAGMNRDACDEAEAAAAALQAEYDALLDRHASDPQTQALIREARDAYETFRQAHLAAFRAASKGSVAPMCHCMAARTLAESQQPMVAASPEGDVCAW